MNNSPRRPNKLEALYSREVLVDLFEKEGRSVYRLAKKLGKGFEVVKSQLCSSGIIPFIIPEKYKFLSKEMLETEYAEMNMEDIAKKYSLRKDKIAMLMRLYEIPIKMNAYSVDEKFFDLDTPESFYIAGIVCADGNIYQDKRHKHLDKFSIGLKGADISHLEKIKLALSFSGPIQTRKREARDKNNPKHNDTYYSVIEIGSKKICASLSRFGITERKSLTYIMPDWLIDHKLVNYFLLGYFDGDGSIFPGKKHQWFANVRGTEKFLEQFHQVLRNHKVVKDENRTISFNGGTYRIAYSCNPTVCAIYEFLLGESKIFLERKNRRYQICRQRLDKTNNKRTERELAKSQTAV